VSRYFLRPVKCGADGFRRNSVSGHQSIVDGALWLTINEIFYSIPGVHLRLQPCVFVRLTAAICAATWCDTTYSFHEGSRMSVDA